MLEFDLDAAIFDGCAFGLISACGKNKGLPIKKPWVLLSDCPALVQGFSGKGCPGPPKHETHASTQGADTVLTGYYTKGMCALIHKCWQKHTQIRQASTAALLADTELCTEPQKDSTSST